jgi:hypothetical protein
MSVLFPRFDAPGKLPFERRSMTKTRYPVNEKAAR